MLHTFEAAPNDPPREAETSKINTIHGIPALILMQLPFSIPAS